MLLPESQPMNVKESESVTTARWLRSHTARWVASIRLVQFAARLYVRLVYEIEFIWAHVRFRALVKRAGSGSQCHHTVWLKYPENLTVGNRVFIMKNATVGCGSPVMIGDDAVIAPGVLIETRGLDVFSGGPPYRRIGKPIAIGRGVWIAANAVILGGVTIGDYAVIGAGAVISRDVPAYAFVNAAPNRVFIRKDIQKEDPTLDGPNETS